MDSVLQTRYYYFIPIEIFKIAFEEVTNPLLNLINSSLENGIVAEKLKRTTVIPLRKVPRTQKAEQFRPVNTPPAMAKILEKIVYVQLLDYVTNNDILTNYQSGFRENYSCEAALQYLLNEWMDNNDKDLVTVTVFLDFKRAFETIDRKRLLNKLENYGIGGMVLSWFENYLTNRKQNVRCGEIQSEDIQVNCGVPQGSILGPLLFILYINDIEKVVRHCKLHLFADDTIMYIAGSDAQDVQHKLSEDLKNVTKWLQQNKLALNATKTKAMMLGKEGQKTKWKNEGFCIKIEGVNIEIVNSFKYLGIIVDDKLSFGEHIEYICKKVSKKLGVLSRCSHFLSKWARETIYNCIILPHFHFASTILYLARKGDIDRLQLLQNRAMRIILKCSRYTAIGSMLKALKWIKIQDFCKMKSLIFIHKIKCGVMPNYFNQLMTKFDEIHDHNTRNKNNYILDHKKYKKNQNSMFFKALIEYNKLPREIKSSINIRRFKLELRNLFLSNI